MASEVRWSTAYRGAPNFEGAPREKWVWASTRQNLKQLSLVMLSARQRFELAKIFIQPLLANQLGGRPQKTRQREDLDFRSSSVGCLCSALLEAYVKW